LRIGIACRSTPENRLHFMPATRFGSVIIIAAALAMLAVPARVSAQQFRTGNIAATFGPQ